MPDGVKVSKLSDGKPESTLSPDEACAESNITDAATIKSESLAENVELLLAAVIASVITSKSEKYRKFCLRVADRLDSLSATEYHRG